MSKIRMNFGRRFTAGLGIVAVTGVSLLGSVMPANGADDPVLGNINPTTSKSLTIHKFEQPATLGTAPDGKELATTATSALTPLKGVTFQIQKVTNIDLATNAGWEATKALTPSAASAHLGVAATGVTDDDGILTFSGLDQAVYLVTETSYSGPKLIAAKAAPFLVTLPLPSSTDSTWIYAVHVYPKNSLTDVTKSVDDSGATGLGSDVRWGVTATVPQKSENSDLTKLWIVDVLDSRLKYKSATVTADTIPAVPLVVTTDYTIDSTTTAGTVSVKFTAAGLQKLAPGAKVNVDLVTTVTSLGDGVIENTATELINDNEYLTNEVATKWGNLLIKKVSSSEPSKLLVGAEFQIYSTLADAKAATNPIDVSGETVFTSDANGIATIGGLRATTNGNSTPVNYWLVETKAPIGYEIAAEFSQATPKQVNVAAGGALTVDVTVADPQTPPFTLPLTGGSGTVAFIVVGAGLISAAGAVAVRSRRTRRVS